MKSSVKKLKLNKYEIYVISGLAHGVPVGKLQTILELYGMEANSISSIEKSLHRLRKV